jgi:hypothetical protein
LADITDFVNFDLLLTAAPGGYRARVVDSPAGEAASSFTLPFSDLEVENLILRLTQRSAGTRRLESVEVGMARTFGTTLFGAVFAGDVGVCWQKSRSVVAQQDYSRLAPPRFRRYVGLDACCLPAEGRLRSVQFLCQLWSRVRPEISSKETRCGGFAANCCFISKYLRRASRSSSCLSRAFQSATETSTAATLLCSASKIGPSATC